MDEIICSATGHRPPRLGLGYNHADQKLLEHFAEQEIIKLNKIVLTKLLLSGGALGWDQAVAIAAFRLSIPYVVAVPFEGQESKWPEESREKYQLILSRATEVQIVCPGPYANWKFAKRDEWLVDNSQGVLALYDGNDKAKRSGTGITVSYARKQRREIYNVWKAWEEYKQCPSSC